MTIIFKDDYVIIDDTEYRLPYEVPYIKIFATALKHIYDKDAIITIEGNRLDILKDGLHNATIIKPILIDTKIILKGIDLINDYNITYKVNPIKYIPEELSIIYNEDKYSGLSSNYDTIYRLLQALAELMVIPAIITEPEVIEIKEEIEEPVTEESEVTEETEEMEGE